MKKTILFVTILMLLSFSNNALPANSQQDSLSKSAIRKSLLLNRDYSQVYKPTKLIIGANNKFSIKAEPGSYVLLLVSSTNDGNEFNDKQLRLGKDVKKVDGVVTSNGFLELNFDLPKDKTLVKKEMYFEVLVSKDKSFTNSEIAKIISPSGRETDINSIKVYEPNDTKLGPSFGAVMPGGGGDMIKTMQTIEDVKNGKTGNPEDYLYNDFSQNSLLLRNLRAADVDKK